MASLGYPAVGSSAGRIYHKICGALYMNKLDRRTKLLLWSLFEPEDSRAVSQAVTEQHRVANGLASEKKFLGLLKSTIWIILSVLLSLTLAHLK